ncbi:MAG: acyl--CoA ligase [Deltaproteobacteria bacterium]|nr:acyl--CoA ligase [Deltaproteobacteria bacterium]
MTYDEVVERLTAAGAPFELEDVTVRGHAMKNFRHREKSLREKIRIGALRGDAVCMVQGERRITYAEHARLVWGAAHALADGFGLRPGDRLAIFAYNCPDWLITLFGAVSVGAIAVGLNGWWTESEVAFGLTDSGSRFLVTDARLYPRVEKIAESLPQLETIFFIGDDAPRGTVPISELLRPRADVPANPIAEDDPAVILYTSGTTGRPKGCITTHGGTVAQVMGIVFAGVANAMLGNGPSLPATGEQPASLLTSPLFHVAGFHSGVCTGLTAGARMVFTEGRFDPEQVMRLIERERISLWGAIPTMLHRVVHHPNVSRYDLSSLKGISFGGAPTPPETLAKAREVLKITPSFTNAYGLTETHGVATLNGGKDLAGRGTSIGRPLPMLEMRIVGPDGRTLAHDELGELCIYGPTVTPGYWNRPDATAEAVRDGWLHTGDLGIRDDAGFYFVLDRAKDMIIRGGENIYCVEIENCLADHPEIDEAAIIGHPDPDLGERVKAVVRRVVGSTLDEAGVRRHAAAHLAPHKVPEIVAFSDAPLPRNPAGKILKNLLRGTGTVAFDPDDLA